MSSGALRGAERIRSVPGTTERSVLIWSAPERAKRKVVVAQKSIFWKKNLKKSSKDINPHWLATGMIWS